MPRRPTQCWPWVSYLGVAGHPTQYVSTNRSAGELETYVKDVLAALM